MSEPAHLGVQKADGAPLRVVGAEGIGANKLGELPGFVGRGRKHRAHFVQHDRHTTARDLPGGLRPRKTSADHVNGCESIGHPLKLGVRSLIGNVGATSSRSF
jgi:hypothetical protein